MSSMSFINQSQSQNNLCKSMPKACTKLDCEKHPDLKGSTMKIEKGIQTPILQWVRFKKVKLELKIKNKNKNTIGNINRF